MPVRGATLYRYEARGVAPAKEDVPDNVVGNALEQLRRYWLDPYSNLGFWKRANPAKSHPGTYSRRWADEGADD